ncbi:hypothetical protein AMTRI_Chr03g139910 [Amborella trichopoda]
MCCPNFKFGLKNLCSPADTPESRERNEEFKWIVKIDKNVRAIRNFGLNHQLVIIIFKWYSGLRFLCVAETRFASSTIMVRRAKLVRPTLVEMVMSEQ